jgi:predicted anti-sigma-YlaC factor YlaD
MVVRELTCKELVELVTDYLEERLRPSERLRFERHLVGCKSCRNYLDQMRETIRLLGRLDEDSIPAPMRERLLRAFRDWKS